MLKTNIATLLAFLSFPLIASAQEVPKFDGVYLGLRDGSYIALNPFGGGIVRLQNSGFEVERNGFLLESFHYTHVNVAFEPDILNAAFFDMENIESIFVRSRSENFESVYMVSLINKWPYLDPQNAENSVRRERVANKIDLEFPSLINTECGFNTKNFDLLNESDTTFKYFWRDTTLNARDGLNIPLYFSIDNACQPAVDGSRAVGFLIRTNLARYFILEANAMREYYLTEDLTGWTSLPELKNKIDLVD